jgi:carbonic anhydrase
VEAIRPAVERARDRPGDLTDSAALANVEMVVGRLRESEPILKAQVAEGRLKIVGAFYHLDSGAVDFPELEAS